MPTEITPPPAVQTLLSQPSLLQTVLTPPAALATTLTAGQGPAGKQGEPGASGASYLTHKAAGPVSGHKVMRPAGLNLVQNADSGTVAHANAVIGISMNAAADGDNVNVQSTGDMVEPTWSWTPGLPIFCGPNGALTQVPPTSGFQLVIGIASSATSIVVGIKFPIIL